MPLQQRSRTIAGSVRHILVTPLLVGWFVVIGIGLLGLLICALFGADLTPKFSDNSGWLPLACAIAVPLLVIGKELWDRATGQHLEWFWQASSEAISASRVYVQMLLDGDLPGYYASATEELSQTVTFAEFTNQYSATPFEIGPESKIRSLTEIDPRELSPTFNPELVDTVVRVEFESGEEIEISVLLLDSRSDYRIAAFWSSNQMSVVSDFHCELPSIYRSQRRYFCGLFCWAVWSVYQLPWVCSSFENLVLMASHISWRRPSVTSAAERHPVRFSRICQNSAD